MISIKYIIVNNALHAKNCTHKLNMEETDSNITIAHTMPSSISAQYSQVSAMIVDEYEQVLYYGKIGEKEDELSTLTIPNDLSDGKYVVKVFAETANGERITDYAIKAVDFAIKIGDDVKDDGAEDFTKPILLAVGTQRFSDNEAIVEFTSDQAGMYYYEVTDAVMEADAIDISGEGIKLCINSVLMVCDKENIGSAKSIINNGGIFKGVVL